jgi:endonuclease/exonuclease/phosphatase family metal-dependent hydrolase
MRIATWNLLHAMAIPPRPADHEKDLRELSHFIKTQLRPDLIAFQEIDNFQERSGAIEQIKAIATHIGADYFFYAPTILGTPGEQWRKHPTHSTQVETVFGNSRTQLPSYGIGIVSRSPVTKWEISHLGRSRIGLPLAVPKENGKGVRFLYVKDEPRIALAAILSNGITVIATHLSFVPLVNLYQLRKLKAWAATLPGETVIVGDLNLPWGLPARQSGKVRAGKWRSLVSAKSYPSWGAKVQFDYILTKSRLLTARQVKSPKPSGFSDHLPLSVDLTF